ncbi:MAG: hypothetical protein ACRBN8_26275 [Nannocystales bacterium]
MNRRSFVVRLSATTVVSGLAGCNGGGSGNGGSSLDLLRVMQVYFGAELATGRLVGERYALNFADDDALELDLEAVVETIQAEDTVDTAVEALRVQVQADFADATMVLVDGWALGLTEARIAGLAQRVYQA